MQVTMQPGKVSGAVQQVSGAMLGKIASQLKEEEEEEDQEMRGSTDEMLKAVKLAERNKNRETWSQRRLCVARMIEHQLYEILMALVIVLNISFIIYETDERAEHGESRGWFKSISITFLLLYGVDLVCRFYVYRWAFFSSNWNILDLAVVTLDLISESLTTAVGDIPSFSVLRVCRIFRVVRFSRVLRMFRELEIMLSGFLSAMKAMVWASVMLVMTLTIWAIVAVEVLHPVNKRLAARNVYADCDRCPRAYDSVFNSLITFLQQILAGDSWGQVSLPIIEEEPWTVLIFFAVLVSINLGLLNLILTVIVDVANAAREDDDQRKLEEKSKTYRRAKKALLEICHDLDVDQSGTLTQHELELGMESNLKFSSTMALLDVSKEDMHLIFGMLDDDDSGTVSYREFVEQLYKVKSQDVHTMLVFIKGYVSEVRGKVTRSLLLLREELVEVKDLANQLRAVVSPTPDDAAIEVPLEVGIVDADATGCKIKEVYATCEVQGKPASRVQTQALTLPGLDWHFHSMVRGYVPGDPLTVSVHGRSGPQEEFRLVAEGILRGEDLMKGEEGFKGDVKCAPRGAEPPTASWGVKVRATPLWGRNGRTTSKTTGKATRERIGFAALEHDLKQFRQDIHDDLAKVTLLLSEKVDSQIAGLRGTLPPPPRLPPKPPTEEIQVQAQAQVEVRKLPKNRMVSQPCGFVEVGGSRSQLQTSNG